MILVDLVYFWYAIWSCILHLHFKRFAFHFCFLVHFVCKGTPLSSSCRNRHSRRRAIYHIFTNFFICTKFYKRNSSFLHVC